MKMKYFLCFNLILFFAISYSCQSGENKKLKNNDKADMDLESIIDTLLCGNILNDSINYDYYLKKNKPAFIKCLIDNIDRNNKKIMIMPVQVNVMSSNIPTKRYYVGCRAICLINQIINPNSNKNELLKNYCITGLMLNENSEITLNDLKEFKTLSLKWYSDTNGLSEEEQRTSWNKLYLSKFQ